MMDSSTNSFAELPGEVQQAILRYLAARDLCSVAFCSRSWREVANQDSLWHPLCGLRGWECSGTTQDICKELPFKPSSPDVASPNIAFPTDVVVTSSDWPELVDTCKWKEVYMKAQHLEANWENNRYHTVSFEFGSAGYLGSWLDVPESESSDPNKTRDLMVVSLDGEGDCLAMGLSNGTVKIWDMSSGKCQHVVNVPVSSDNQSVKMKNGTVAVGCTDGQIRTYSAKTGEPLRTLRGHDWKVTHVFFDGEIIVSAVYADPVFNDGRNDEDWEELEDELREQQQQNDQARTGAKDSDIQVFGSAGNASNFLLRYNLGNLPLIYVAYHNKIVAAAYRDKVICLWDARTGTQLHAIPTGMNRLVSCHLGKDFVIGTNDMNNPVMKIWNLSSGDLLKMFDFPDVRLLDEDGGFEVNTMVTHSFDPENPFLVTGSIFGVVGAFGLDGKYVGDTSTVRLADPRDILKLLLSFVLGNKIVVGDFCDARMSLLIYSKKGGFRLIKELRSKMFDEIDDDAFNRAWMSPTKLAFPSYFLDKEELKDIIRIPKMIVHHYW